jgi:hypothetical protein
LFQNTNFDASQFDQFDPFGANTNTTSSTADYRKSVNLAPLGDFSSFDDSPMQPNVLSSFTPLPPVVPASQPDGDDTVNQTPPTFC